MYEDLSVFDLKRLGHSLIIEYIALEPERAGNTIEHVYRKLQTKLGTMYGKHHFAKMETREEAIRACAALRKMIKSRKKKLEYRSHDVYAPRGTGIP